MRANGDDDDARGRSIRDDQFDDMHATQGDFMDYDDDDDGDDAGDFSPLSAKAAAAGFSPVRSNKSRPHNLDVDPRTKLRIINVPTDCRVAFADLQDVVLHIFVDCYKVTSADQHVDRVLIVTDQSLLLCAKDGSCSRCVMIDRLKALSVNNDKRALAIQIPSEYDILLKFLHPSDRDRVVKVIRAVYRRMARQRLPVEIVRARKFDPAAFKVKKPPTFRLTLIPQRTREQLRQALEAFEHEEGEILDELDTIQDEMQRRHAAQMADMQATLLSKIQQYRDVVNSVWDSDAKLKKLRDDVAKSRRLIEEVDGAFGPDGELPVSKDSQIAELELVVARLNAAVYVSGSEQLRRRVDDKGSSTFFQRDVQGQLFQPSWPLGSDPSSLGVGAGGDLQSLAKALTERLGAQQKEIDGLRGQLEAEETIEAQMALVQERIARLRHLQRTANYRTMITGGGGAGGGGVGGSGGAEEGGNNVTVGADGQPMPSGRGTAVGDSVDRQLEWLRGLPQEISTATITYDPRTRLRFVEVPPALSAHFKALRGRVVHFFAIVRKQTKGVELEKRVFFITDLAVFLATLSSDVKRYIEVGDLDEIVTEPGTTRLGLRASSQYDLVVTCATHEHRHEIISVLQKIYNYHSGGRSIPVTEIQNHQRIEAFLRLQQPPDFKMPTMRLTSREDLIEKIRERRDVILHNAQVTSSASSALKPHQLDMPQEQFAALRRRIAEAMDLDWRQDEALQQLRRRCDELNAQLSDAGREVTRLNRLYDDHIRDGCRDGVRLSSVVSGLPSAPGAGVIPSARGAGRFRPEANGLFFIKVDPVQLDCGLDVQRLCFFNDLLFTGHQNGFINIWDLRHQQSAGGGGDDGDGYGGGGDYMAPTADQPLLRTLREHKGRVTDLVSDSAHLFSASTDGTIRKWELRTGRCVVSYRPAPKSSESGHVALRAVNAIAFDGKQLISGGDDMRLCMWDTETGSLFTYEGHNAPILGVRRFEDRAVTIDWGWMHLWDLRTGRIERSVSDAHGGLRCVDFNGAMAVCGSTGGDVTVWDTERGAGETISGHTDDVSQVQIAGRSAITAAGDCTIKLWDIEQCTLLGTFDTSHPLETRCFQMTDRRFVAGQGQFVKIWTK